MDETGHADGRGWSPQIINPACEHGPRNDARAVFVALLRGRPVTSAQSMQMRTHNGSSGRAKSVTSTVLELGVAGRRNRWLRSTVACS
jgi:hypothetical protein